jgi:hypothetical protein
VQLNGAAASGVCRGQTVLAMSSSEAEFRACCVVLTEAKDARALMVDWGAEAAAARHFTDSSGAIVHASLMGLGGPRHRELEFLWVQREADEGRVSAGLASTTNVATKHMGAAALTRRQVALGLIIFTGEFLCARAAGEEPEGGGNALFVVMTFLAAAGTHALLDGGGRAARRLCHREHPAGAATPRSDAACQTDPSAASTRATDVSSALSALYVARYGECVHVSSTCRGLASARHAVQELRPCAICMPRWG